MPPSKLPIGRPSKFDPKYCAQLQAHMAAGYSFESFGGVIGVSRDTLYEWKKVHPDFSDAVGVAKTACLLWWERLGHQGIQGQVPGFNGAIYGLNMKNRFGWRDRPEDGEKDQAAEPLVIKRFGGAGEVIVLGQDRN